MHRAPNMHTDASISMLPPILHRSYSILPIRTLNIITYYVFLADSFFFHSSFSSNHLIIYYVCNICMLLYWKMVAVAVFMPHCTHSHVECEFKVSYLLLISHLLISMTASNMPKLVMLWQVKFIHYIIIILLMRARARAHPFQSNVDGDSDDDDGDGGGSFLRSFNFFHFILLLFFFSIFLLLISHSHGRYATHTHHNVKNGIYEISIYGYCSSERIKRNKSKTTTQNIIFTYVFSRLIIILLLLLFDTLTRTSVRLIYLHF